MKVVERTVEVKNKSGLHVRTATLIAKTALRFLSKVTLLVGDNHANARSVVDMTRMVTGPGTLVTLRAEGPDAESAVQAIQSLFEDKFGED